MGEFGRPCESSASISTRSTPAACLTAVSAPSSVMRSPCAYLERRLCLFNSASICGRAPCTSTRRISSAASRLMSWMKLAKRARSATSSPPKATTKVRPPKSCTYGATWRNQRTKFSGCVAMQFFQIVSAIAEPGLCAMLAGMRTIIALLCALPIAVSAAEQEDATFGHFLTLIQTFTSIAAQSASPERDIADVFSGRNETANKAASGLWQEITADMPAAQRSQMSAIGADLLSIARRGATPFSAPGSASASDSIQARKDLTAMGLKYHDQGDFL